MALRFGTLSLLRIRIDRIEAELELYEDDPRAQRGGNLILALAKETLGRAEGLLVKGGEQDAFEVEGIEAALQRIKDSGWGEYRAHSSQRRER